MQEPSDICQYGVMCVAASAEHKIFRDARDGSPVVDAVVAAELDVFGSSKRGDYFGPRAPFFIMPNTVMQLFNENHKNPSNLIDSTF